MVRGHQTRIDIGLNSSQFEENMENEMEQFLNETENSFANEPTNPTNTNNYTNSFPVNSKTPPTINLYSLLFCESLAVSI